MTTPPAVPPVPPVPTGPPVAPAPLVISQRIPDLLAQRDSSLPLAAPALARAESPSGAYPRVAGGSLLEATGLAKSYKGRRVVNDVSVRLEQGEIVGLLGPNGAGKTTTFYMITGLIRPDRGRIAFDGRDVTAEPMYQ